MEEPRGTEPQCFASYAEMAFFATAGRTRLAPDADPATITDHDVEAATSATVPPGPRLDRLFDLVATWLAQGGLPRATQVPLGDGPLASVPNVDASGTYWTGTALPLGLADLLDDFSYFAQETSIIAESFDGTSYCGPRLYSFSGSG